MIEADENKAEIDTKRTAIFTLLGGVLVSPVLHVWYGFLGSRVAGVSTLAVAKRLALDQLGFAPTFLCVFLSSLLTLEGEAKSIPDKLRADWWPAMKANWGVWVPAQILNFRFVPGSMQVLFSNVVGLAWNTYLSYISHLEVPKSIEVARENETVTTAECSIWYKHHFFVRFSCCICLPFIFSQLSHQLHILLTQRISLDA
ncbi:hypothetical protein BBJ29_005348 [Phytophthora kernoviae]|uniref:Peroxisomal membrane protein MPV17 n=1 Tax=Phytophthora kernoviae TaxID=325452 RepID=A0A3F2RVJ3_9STRA|nr:hypothetical protein BBP00_00003714 [Phytophthora kernoviae]RLN71247.1 hypothetical protein BBJ29_005348 [Phytophthora kernoviae]